MKKVYEIAKNEKIRTENLWIDNIPETIFINDIKRKYNIGKQKNEIRAVIGEFDDPYNQRQGPVYLDLTRDGNTIIFGNADSGKETLIGTAVYDLITNYEAKEVEIYLLDFGSEALKIFKNSPQVGDVVLIRDNEKIKRFFEMLQKEIAKRVQILSEYGGDYNLYINTSKEQMPMEVVFINGYEVFSENFEDQYEDIFLTLTRDGIKCGIVFVITASNPSDIRYRLSQNFKKKISLQMNNEDDYMNVFEGIGKKKPSHIFGRGLIKLEDVFEFQTAKICESRDWNVNIKKKIEALQGKATSKAKPIPVLPAKVNISDVERELKDITKIPIGISKQTLDVFLYNFKKDFVNIITAKNLDLTIQFTENLIEEMKLLDNINIVIIDTEKAIKSEKNNWFLDYEKFMHCVEKNLNNDKETLCIIIGLDKFINELEYKENEFMEILKKAKELMKYSFLIVEKASKIKEHEYEEWYKEYISGDTGIWIGNGVDEQYVINISLDRRVIENNCGKSFAHVINEGEAIVVKILGVQDK